MSGHTDESEIESYILRLLDECREEIRTCDGKASILFAGVAFGAAMLADPLVDDESALRASGLGIVIVAGIALVALGVSMWLLGLAVVPRLAHPVAGEARYFEEQAEFSDVDALFDVLRKDAQRAPDRHAQQLLILSRIARRKYRHLRHAMYAVCLAVGLLVVDALVVAVRSW